MAWPSSSTHVTAVREENRRSEKCEPTVRCCTTHAEGQIKQISYTHVRTVRQAHQSSSKLVDITTEGMGAETDYETLHAPKNNLSFQPPPLGARTAIMCVYVCVWPPYVLWTPTSSSIPFGACELISRGSAGGRPAREFPPPHFLF